MGQARIAAFRQALAGLGWTEESNLKIEWRWTGGDIERVRDFAAELVRLAPDVIIATPSVAALKHATTTIPIVFSVVNDPVRPPLPVLSVMALPQAAQKQMPVSSVHLATRPLLPQHQGSTPILADDVERILANIDADHGDCAIESLGVMACSFVFGALLPVWLAGRAGARPDHPILRHRCAILL